MPYKKIDDVPENLKIMDGVKLTLGQINEIAAVADALTAEGKVDNPWAVAKAQFKDNYKIDGDKWVKKDSSFANQSGRKTVQHDIANADAGHAKPKEGNPEDPMVMPTYGIDGVEIFRAGTWESSCGDSLTYTVDDLGIMIKNSRDGGIPLTLGHWCDGDDPAIGWISGMEVSGKSIYCNIDKIPYDIYAGILQGSWRDRSCEVYWRDGKPDEICAVALLGARQGALPLKPMYERGAGKTGKEYISHLYSTENDNKHIETNSENENGGVLNMAENKELIATYEKQVADAQKEKSDALAKVSEYEKQLSEKDAAHKTEIATYEKQVGDLKAENETLKTQTAEYEKQAYAATKAAFQKSIERKVQPADMEDVLALYDVKATGEPAAFEAWKEKYSKRPDNELLSAQAESSKADAPGDGAEALSKESVEKYCKDKGWNPDNADHYARAMIEIHKAQKDNSGGDK